jgi:hypothetical protein
MEPAGHEANGFDRRYLHEWEACALYEVRYMAPPDLRCPGTWRLSAGLNAAELASFDEVQPGTLDFILVWSRQDAKKAEKERARRLDLCVNLEDDDDNAGPSQWRDGDNDEGCSTWAVKNDAPPDNDDDGGDYDVFYQRLGMQ